MVYDAMLQNHHSMHITAVRLVCLLIHLQQYYLQ